MDVFGFERFELKAEGSQRDPFRGPVKPGLAPRQDNRKANVSLLCSEASEKASCCRALALCASLPSTPSFRKSWAAGKLLRPDKPRLRCIGFQGLRETLSGR